LGRKNEKPGIKPGLFDEDLDTLIVALDRAGRKWSIVRLPNDKDDLAGRQHYFWALQKHWPEVLNVLQSEVFPVYQPRWHEGDLQRVPILESWGQLQSDPDRSELFERLKHWANQFRITEDWIFEAALETLLIYSPGPPLWKARGDEWLWRYRPKGFHPLFEAKLENTVWYPTQLGWSESWDAFKNRFESQLSAQLAEYRRMVERKFGIGRDRIDRDAEWTVRYQRGIPALEIAIGLTGYSDPEQAVYRAVERFAASIGLTLRKNSTRCTRDPA
jgi:hypothetical protein